MRRSIIFTILLTVSSIVHIHAQGCMSGGGDVIGVHGFIQPQYNYYINGTDDAGNSLDQNSFLFNRARLGVMGSIPYDIDYYFVMEFSHFKNSAKQVHMLDAYVSYTRFSKYAKLSLGQFKSPFSMEQNTACSSLYTINRSDVVTQLAGPQRDLGLMIGGELDSLGMTYSLGIMNGSGINVEDDNNNKHIVARLTYKPFDFLQLGGSFNTGKINPTDPTQPMNDQMRLGGELLANIAGIRLQSEYIYGRDKLNSASKVPVYGGCGGIVGFETKQAGTYMKDGFLVMMSYLTPSGLEPVVKFDTYNADFDASNKRTNYITLGLNYYINDYSRLQLNYVNVAESSAITNDLIMVQLQAKF